jgi:threonylcarbamoyladenosine tRNA methylthiotransferase MtaB
MKKVAIATLGCKTNQFESAAIIEKFTDAGYCIVPFTEVADLYVVNSCTVTAKSDAETRRLIRRARRLNQEARIVATGCYAQVSPTELDSMPEVDIVLGNIEKLDTTLLAEATDNQVADSSHEEHISPLKLSSFAEHTRAFLQIQNGCNSFCTYCIVPYARGRSRSVSADEIIHGIQRLVHNGFKEVVLTGIHLGAYGLDSRPVSSLESLIRLILSETELKRLRIGSIDPHEFSDELIALCSDSDRICRHFHISLQSGCNTVLERMGRTYDSAYFRGLLGKIIKVMPEAFIGTDIIAGFPGETEQEFTDTCSFAESLPLADIHVFPYSSRPKTKAAGMPGHLNPAVINERAAVLRGIASNKKEQFLLRNVGRQILVLGQQYNAKTGLVTGISREYLQACFKGSAADINLETPVLVNGIEKGQAVCLPLTCPKEPASGDRRGRELA